MSSKDQTSAAAILSIIGAVIIIFGGIMFIMLAYGGIGFGMMGGFDGMMRGYMDMMEGFGFPLPFMGGLSFVAIASGVLVLVGGIMLSVHPEDSNTWGIVILVFSIISFLGMGGYFIGAILGIIGGALALA